MALTDTAIRNLKPQNGPYKKSDGAGLYLLIKPNGSKLWQWGRRARSSARRGAAQQTRFGFVRPPGSCALVSDRGAKTKTPNCWRYSLRAFRFYE